MHIWQIFSAVGWTHSLTDWGRSLDCSKLWFHWGLVGKKVFVGLGWLIIHDVKKFYSQIYSNFWDYCQAQLGKIQIWIRFYLLRLLTTLTYFAYWICLLFPENGNTPANNGFIVSLYFSKLFQQITSSHPFSPSV